ncbi:MAG TPA: 4Fe-4S dicluster domain-containing protein [Candidatus Paceibacterota bacterium]|nr:4Fe-4S dicluster domain-containing protein [Verrucomicrobiota bacterium]HOX04316.1 4Fe-4S dicluster domain-containing protein [Verrucomicrobiota bacterium]HRZ47206.1 4Fe-4S dicluster domain-containing protein [Candidatus Paceibacterota bacterium]HRZ94940.1 4Fe-4S dicluster domain-containing protein [Candidatus Paceibacterota bacterium]
MDLPRTIKYEADRVAGFGKEVMSVPGCENLQSCIQCGTCSGVCPLSIYMDYSPRQVMALTRSDFKNEVLRSHTIWLCASCYACTVECPRQIRITDIMYELKQRAIHDGIYPKKFPIPVLAKEFYKMAHKQGRVTDNWLATWMFLKTNWRAALGMWRLGLGLIKRGRFSFTYDSIRQKDQLARMMQTVDNLSIDALTDAKPKRKASH